MTSPMPSFSLLTRSCRLSFPLIVSQRNRSNRCTLNTRVRYQPRQYNRPNFVGVREHPLKYDFIWSKRDTHTYGIQGVNHLVPEKGFVAKRLPIKMKLEKGKVYAWCNCGYSHNQPLCDGSHKREKTNLRPVRFIPDKDMEVWFCTCKQTTNRPFCDGTHKTLPSEQTPTTAKK